VCSRAVVWYEARVLCLGLDGAGKTSVLQRAGDRGSPEPVEPTNGFNVKALNVPPDWKIDAWDIGGSAAVRPYWDRYVTLDTRALIWVLDGSDRVRLEEASSELRALLESDARLRGTPLLVLLNKCDRQGGLSVHEARDALRLIEQPGGVRAVHVHACSAATGEGIAEALRWLSETLTATLR